MMTNEERRRRRFSKEFRKKQVELIESGELTVNQVATLYEVRPANVYKWVKAFGIKEKAKTILVSDGSEYDRVKELEKQVAELTSIIGKQQVELVYNRELMAQAEKRYGVDFKKNS